MDKYRFDDAYGKVYEYDETQRAYIFCGTYFAYGIKANMPESKKVLLVEKNAWNGLLKGARIDNLFKRMVLHGFFLT